MWAAVATFEGINDEFRPLFRMTAPARVRREGLAAVEVGRRVCRLWVLLSGVLPVDYDDITLMRIKPPNGFLERSAMLSQRAWEHERTLEAVGVHCRLTDRVRYEPRLPLPDAVLHSLYRFVFRHRHRRLRFGGHAVERGVE